MSMFLWKNEDVFTPQAGLVTSNFGGMELELSTCGDGVRYRWNFGEPEQEVTEAELEYDEDGDPFFTVGEGDETTTYHLNEFMKIGYH